jgi:hemolysin-activating ACP:hemolysin acyltransferase
MVCLWVIPGIWAWLTDEASSEYEKGSNHITGHDFVGGTNLWIVEMVMPFGDVRANVK